MPEAPVIKLSGEIDLAVAPTLQDRLLELRSQGATNIVVDLLDATFLDSIALGVLVEGQRQCRQADGDLHLVVVEPRILKVLEITGLSDVFALHESQGERSGATGTGPSS
jgi:anti-sigma B factor antagonist